MNKRGIRRQKQPASQVDAAIVKTAVDDFLRVNPRALVLIAGALEFEMQQAQYSVENSVSGCVLQIWSSQRNIIRRVMHISSKPHAIVFKTLRLFGKPDTLTIVDSLANFVPGSRKYGRQSYRLAIESIIKRKWDGCKVDPFVLTTDRVHNLTQLYCRGTIMDGGHKWAVICGNSGESHASVDGILTAGILWLDRCREINVTRPVKGLRVIVPAGHAAEIAGRMAWLDTSLASWQLWGANLTKDTLVEVAVKELNLPFCHIYSTHIDAVPDMFHGPVTTILDTVPHTLRRNVEVRSTAPGYAILSYKGLSFAQIRMVRGEDIALHPEITFGTGKVKTLLTKHTSASFSKLFACLVKQRDSGNDNRSELFRANPDGWLKSTLTAAIPVVDHSIDTKDCYWCVTKSPAGRSLDLLAKRNNGRLVTFKVSAKDTIHLPMQALDLWRKVVNAVAQDLPQGEHYADIKRRLDPVPAQDNPVTPLLLLVVPCFRLHPRTEAVLRYFSKQIDWQVVALNEGWRKNPQVVFRKHPSRAIEAMMLSPSRNAFLGAKE